MLKATHLFWKNFASFRIKIKKFKLQSLKFAIKPKINTTEIQNTISKMGWVKNFSIFPTVEPRYTKYKHFCSLNLGKYIYIIFNVPWCASTMCECYQVSRVRFWKYATKRIKEIQILPLDEEASPDIRRPSWDLAEFRQLPFYAGWKTATSIRGRQIHHPSA